MAAKAPPPEFDLVFDRLQAIMQSQAKGALKSQARPGTFTLLGPASPASRNRELWFGEVRKGKAYVSYHLIGVYANPALLDDISPELKKHMQGKSCFNFRSVDDKLFKELSALTRKSYTSLRQAKLIP